MISRAAVLLLAAPCAAIQVAGAQVTPRPCAVQEMTVTPPDARVSVGTRVRFVATVYDLDGSPCGSAMVTWSSSNVNVLRIDQEGVATAVAPGNAIVTARAASAPERAYSQAAVVVTEARATIAALEVAPRQAQVRVGQTARIVATARDSSGNEVAGARFVWASSDLTVARVGADGIVTGLTPGQAIVYVGAAGRRGFVAVAVEVLPGGRP